MAKQKNYDFIQKSTILNKTNDTNNQRALIFGQKQCFLSEVQVFMQNKPNLCRFQAKNNDCEEKQTQNKPKTNPIQTQFQKTPK